jgi:hypothetical protein
VRDAALYGENVPVLMVPRKCPFILMKVTWRESKALGSEKVKLR